MSEESSCNCSTQEVIKICKCWIPAATRNLYDIEISCQQKNSSSGCTNCTNSTDSNTSDQRRIPGSPKSFSLNDPDKFRQSDNDCRAFISCDPIIPLISRVKDELDDASRNSEKCVHCCLRKLEQRQTADKQIQTDNKTEVYSRIKRSLSAIVGSSRESLFLHKLSSDSDKEANVYSISNISSSEEVTTYESTSSQTESSDLCSLECMKKCADDTNVQCRNAINCFNKDIPHSLKSTDTVNTGMCWSNNRKRVHASTDTNSESFSNSQDTDDTNTSGSISNEIEQDTPTEELHNYRTETKENCHSQHSTKPKELKDEWETNGKINPRRSRKTNFDNQETLSSRGETSTRYGSIKSVTFDKKKKTVSENSGTESLMNTRDSLEIIKEKTQHQLEDLIDRGSAFSVYFHTPSKSDLKRTVFIGDRCILDEPEAIYRIKVIHFKSGLLIKPKPLMCKKLQQENADDEISCAEKGVQVEMVGHHQKSSLTRLQNFPTHEESLDTIDHDWRSQQNDGVEHDKSWKTYCCNKIIYLDL